MKFLTLLAVPIMVLFFAAGPARCDDQAKIEERYITDTINFLDSCGAKELSLCVKERALQYVETLPSDLDLGFGLSLRPSGESNQRTSRQYKNSSANLPSEPDAREEAVDELLTEKMTDYVSSRTIHFKMPKSALHDIKKSFDEGRGKNKKNPLPLLILLKLKMATLGALALKTLSVVAFKALLVAKIALTLSLIVAIKTLSESGGHGDVARYEVVAHDDHHRSLELPYRGYANKYPESLSS